MQIRLDHVRSEPFRWNEVETVPAATLQRSELLNLGEITWQGEIGHVPPGFRLQAELSYEQSVACSRCLAPIVQPVDRKVDLMIMVEQAPPEPGERELEERDLGLMVIDQGTLDLQPILLEQLQLAIAMRSLCKDDCLGLCPVCGGDRNQRECDCERDATDPRWAELAELKGRLGDVRNDG